jgi:hypothetical protein
MHGLTTVAQMQVVGREQRHHGEQQANTNDE